MSEENTLVWSQECFFFSKQRSLSEQKESSGKEEKAFRKKESDEQQEKNSQKERTIELEISELTSWLLGYKIPENISETVKAEICCINRIFLDEIV